MNVSLVEAYLTDVQQAAPDLADELRYVVNLARRNEWRGSLPDLIQSGNVGLLRAKQRPFESNVKFVYYARHWIINEIRAELAASLPLPLPVNVYLAVQRYLAEVRAGKDPEEAHRAATTHYNCTPAALADGLAAFGIIAQPLFQVGGENDEEYCVLDLFGAVQESVEESVQDRANVVAILEAIDALPYPQGPLIRKVFGIDEPEVSIKAVGKVLGIPQHQVQRELDAGLCELRRRLRLPEQQEAPTHRFSEAEVAAIRADYASGMTGQEVAERWGVSHTYLYRHRIISLTDSTGLPGANTILDWEKVAAIREEFDQRCVAGEKRSRLYHELAERYGTGYHAMKNVCQRKTWRMVEREDVL